MATAAPNRTGEGRDAVHAAFLRASTDGRHLASESEWRGFLAELAASAVCSTNAERRVLEEAWATCETPSEKKLSWPRFRNAVVSRFVQDDVSSNAARDAVRRVRAAATQLQSLALVDGAPIYRCRELLERCRDADEALLAGERLVETSLRHCERGLEAKRLRNLVRGDRRGNPVDATPSLRPANPVQWQLDHALDVEKASAHVRVATRDQVRFPRGGGVCDDDAWGLKGATGGHDGLAEVRKARVLCADGTQRDAYVVAVLPPRRADPRAAAACRRAAWRVFAAHRELATAACVPRAYGWVEEQPGSEGRVDRPERNRTRLSARPFER